MSSQKAILKRGTIALLLLAVSAAAWSQTPMETAFSYQGQLKLAGMPLDDTADFEFTLWDAEAGGNMVGSMCLADAVGVANGLFTVKLDFGVDVFNGDARWLEITVRSPAGSGGYTTLSPRHLKDADLIIGSIEELADHLLG